MTAVVRLAVARDPGDQNGAGAVRAESLFDFVDIGRRQVNGGNAEQSGLAFDFLVDKALTACQRGKL
jgi:hypothetical protein